MNNKDFEGQLDFLGLLSEYTDDQGAKVRVREPGLSRRTRSVPPPEPEQLSFDFTVSEPQEEIEVSKPQKRQLEEENSERQKQAESKPTKLQPIDTKSEKKPEEVKTENQVKEAEVTKEQVEKNEKSKKKEKQQLQPEPESLGKEKLFTQCSKCWCFDCKHNARNEGVKRDVCGISMACPACKSCIDEDNPTICEIGNAKEGCMTRALEEGIVVLEEYEE